MRDLRRVTRGALTRGVIAALALALAVLFGGCGRTELDVGGDDGAAPVDVAPGDVPSGEDLPDGFAPDGEDVPDGADVPDAARVLTSIALSPPAVDLPVGTTQSLTVTGLYSDGTNADVTAMAAFTVDNPAVVGLMGNTAAGLAPGVGTVTATVGALSATARITVPTAPLRSITVLPGMAAVGIGGVVRFTADGTLADGTHVDVTSSVVWDSTDPGVARVDASGVATGVSAGTATVTASLGAIRAWASSRSPRPPSPGSPSPR